MNIKSKKQNDLVVKSNELNFYSLFDTGLQLKLFSKVISLIRKNPNEDSHTVYISDILEEFGMGRGNYTQVKNLAKKMEVFVDMPQELSDISSFKEYEVQDRAPPFKRIKTNNPSTITFEINNILKSHLIDLSGSFSSYYLENILYLKSKASIRLYEILNQYKGIKKYKIKLGKLKLMIGIKEGEYKFYKDFKRRFLLKAQKELADKTDLSFTFEEVKSGRKVDELIFRIKDNFDIKNKIPLENLKMVNEIDETNNQKVKTKKFSEEEIENAYSELLSEKKKDNPIVTSYPFNLSRIDELINLGISKKDIEKEFIKLSQEIDDFSEDNIEKLLYYFLNQTDVKNVISGKKEVKSQSSYIFTLIKNRSFLNQETLTKIIKKSETDNKKEEEKNNKKEKYQIRNAEPFWQFICNYLDLKKQEDWGKMLKFELLNFSLIENKVMYLIFSKSDDNSRDKFHRDNLLREKENLILTINKMLEMDVFKDIGQINDLKISIEDEYSFRG